MKYRLIAMIQSLPNRGTLYHAAFANDTNTGEPLLRYDQLIYDPLLLIPVRVGQNVRNSISTIVLPSSFNQ
jgi:hypothetical protein